MKNTENAQVAQVPAVPAITVEALKAYATKLPADEPARSEMIRAIAVSAGTLGPIERDSVLSYLKNVSGIPMGALRAEAALGGKGQEPDHLELARATLAEIGAGNVIYADGALWLWSVKGVWSIMDDKALKQRVQSTIAAADHTVTAARVNGVADVLRNEIYQPEHAFNRGAPDTVNCLNGELEMTVNGWTLRPHCRENYRTTQIPVLYDPTAHAPMFWQFLHDVFRDDPDREAKIRVVLELMGYTLMSHARHEKFVLLKGKGANGKSVLLRVIEALAGKANVAAVKPSQFDNKFQRAHLHMKLANIVTELPEGKLIADDELKAITSGELTTVEQKNRDPFDMRAFSTCWFGTNHMPHTRDFSDGLFRRAVILEFNRTFALHEQDANLADKLIAELPGILNYALVSYANALTNGFTVPPSSEAAKTKWRAEADQVRQFVDERCLRDPVDRVAVDALYDAFRAWAVQSGIRQIVSKRAMGDRLENLGFGRQQSSGRWITGLRLA